jgi:hypothetical protein
VQDLREVVTGELAAPIGEDLWPAIVGQGFLHSLGVEGGNVFYDDTGLPDLSKKKSTHAIDCIVAAAMTTGRADAGHGGPSICESVEKRSMRFPMI